MIEQLYIRLCKRKAQMEEEIFLHQPADWSAFQNRVGQWMELNLQITEIKAIIDGKEDKL